MRGRRRGPPRRPARRGRPRRPRARAAPPRAARASGRAPWRRAAPASCSSRRRRTGRAICAAYEGPGSSGAGPRSAATRAGACRGGRGPVPGARAPWRPGSPRPCGARGGPGRGPGGSAPARTPRARGTPRHGRACARWLARGPWPGRWPGGSRQRDDDGAPPHGQHGPRARFSTPAAISGSVLLKAHRRRPVSCSPSSAGRRRRRPCERASRRSTARAACRGADANGPPPEGRPARPPSRPARDCRGAVPGHHSDLGMPAQPRGPRVGPERSGRRSSGRRRSRSTTRVP